MYLRYLFRSQITLLIILTHFYFGMFVPLLVLFDYEVVSTYYDFSSFSSLSQVVIIICHLISCVIVCLFLRRFPPRVALKVSKIKSLEMLLIIYFLVNIFLFMTTSRTEIKLNSNFFTSATATIAVAYGASIIFAADRLKAHFLMLAVLAVFIISKGEREYLIMLGLALVLRDQWSLRSSKTWIILGSAVLVIIFFKGMTLLIKDPAAFLAVQGGLLEATFSSSINDSLHVTGLFASYLDGNAPSYRVASALWPVQLEELFNSAARSNSFTASDYYADLKTGVGFSGMLDFWHTFHILAPILFALLLVGLLYISFKTHSMFLLICVLIFIIKFMRAELYAAAITLLVGPFSVYFFHRLFLAFKQASFR